MRLFSYAQFMNNSDVLELGYHLFCLSFISPLSLYPSYVNIPSFSFAISDLAVY
jgi:hypothetical protein